MIDSAASEGRAWTRILVTIALLAVLQVVAMLGVPGVSMSKLDGLGGSSGSRPLSIIALGIAPFWSGFILVELLSFVLPMGRKLRHGGVAGRSKLNSFAIRVGLLLAALQATAIGRALQSAVVPRGGNLLPNPELLYLLSTVVTLVAGATLTLVIAKLVSRWGIGNGFCLIILLGQAWPHLRQVHSYISAIDLAFGSPIEVLALLAAIVLVVRRFWLHPMVALWDANQEAVPLLTLPAFPQGILPVLWAYAVLNFLRAFGSVIAPASSVGRSPLALLGMTVLIAAFSFGAFHLFSGQQRLQRNMPPNVLPAERGVIPRRTLLQSTVLLVVFGVTFPIGERLLDFRFPAFAFPTLVIAVALGFDLVAEWRFRQRHGDRVACLIEMDNVYCACYLHGVLAKKGFDSLIRAFHYRSLFFDFGPIVKMELLVPLAESKLLREIVQPERIEVI